LLNIARRASRDPGGADDLVQQAWLAALERGVELANGRLRHAWLAGTNRKLGALEARTALRRRQREASWAAAGARSAEAGATPRLPAPFIASLPRSVRSVAQLVAADLSAVEIRWILGLADTAWRQRLLQLRRRWLAWPDSGQADSAPACQALAGRRSSLVALARERKHSAFLATDPDGHVLIFSRAPLTQRRPPAT
jgi:RNA polymerase sigma-70 factor (ECF subfamily)